MKKLLWVLFAFFAISIGLYPISFIPGLRGESLLDAKGVELLSAVYYLPVFYLHISLGGLALLVGWSQFSKSIRSKKLKLHRLLGKVYVFSVLISGVSGFIIGLNAEGGLVSILGFIGLAIAWLSTTFMAYVKIKAKQIDAHQDWMIRSYAACFAAVMLRLYLPLFLASFGMEFLDAYRIIAWLCWVPNLIVAEIIIVRLKSKRKSLTAAA